MKGGSIRHQAPARQPVTIGISRHDPLVRTYHGSGEDIEAPRDLGVERLLERP
jgi:hypothetical protein